MRQDMQRTATEHTDEPAGSRKTTHRHTVQEAASLLGLSVDAVRKRAERGSLKKEKAPDGPVYIALDTDHHPATEHATRHRTKQDDTVTPQDLLVSSLKEQIAYLRSEL